MKKLLFFAFIIFIVYMANHDDSNKTPVQHAQAEEQKDDPVEREFIRAVIVNKGFECPEIESYVVSSYQGYIGVLCVPEGQSHRSSPDWAQHYKVSKSGNRWVVED